MIGLCQWDVRRTFEMFSTAIEWVAKTHLSMPHLLHILDDYLMAAPTFHQCRINLDRFLSLCTYLGVPMVPEKTVGPENILVFAGIELDTHAWRLVYLLTRLQNAKH